jgi:hypothetical protein
VSVVLDFGLWARAERDELRTVAHGLGVGVELHYVNAPIDKLSRRIEIRNLEPPWDNEPILLTHLVEWPRAFRSSTQRNWPCLSATNANCLGPGDEERTRRAIEQASGDGRSRSGRPDAERGGREADGTPTTPTPSEFALSD